MIAFTLILLLALAGGALALAYGLKRAVVGYEDETGFHAEAPAPPISGSEVRSTTPEQSPASRQTPRLGKKPLHPGPAAA